MATTGTVYVPDNGVYAAPMAYRLSGVRVCSSALSAPPASCSVGLRGSYREQTSHRSRNPCARRGDGFDPPQLCSTFCTVSAPAMYTFRGSIDTPCNRCVRFVAGVTDGSRPSRPREFHPEPLTEPCANLSIYTARATDRRLPPSVEIWSSSCCQLTRSRRR
jgi:hypothetical protein